VGRINILWKQKQPRRDLTLKCRGEQESDPPCKFTEIHLHYIIEGDVEQEKLEKAIHLSEEKYCSVIATLRLGVPISSDYEVHP
jgi:putative redox protein